MQKKELSTLGPSVTVIFRLHYGKICRAKFQPVKTCLAHLLSKVVYPNNNIANKNKINKYKNESGTYKNRNVIFLK